MNEIVVAGFAIALLAARLIAGEKTFLEIPVLRSILQWVLIVSAVHIIGCFITGLFAGKENKEWWEQSGDRSKKNRGGNLADLYFNGLIVSLPLFTYGLLAYTSLFQSWETLAGVTCAYVIIGLVRYFQRRKKSPDGADQRPTSETIN